MTKPKTSSRLDQDAGSLGNGPFARSEQGGLPSLELCGQDQRPIAGQEYHEACARCCGSRGRLEHRHWVGVKILHCARQCDERDRWCKAFL